MEYVFNVLTSITILNLNVVVVAATVVVLSVICAGFLDSTFLVLFEEELTEVFVFFFLLTVNFEASLSNETKHKLIIKWTLPEFSVSNFW